MKMGKWFQVVHLPLVLHLPLFLVYLKGHLEILLLHG